MDIKNIQRSKAKERKKTITIRVNASNCKFMKDNNISPTKLFNEALKLVMKK